MLDSIIKTAENLWNQIAGGKKQSWAVPPTTTLAIKTTWLATTKKVASWIVFFKVKPFKDNEFWVSHWENILRNLSSVHGDISFVVKWNVKKIELFIGVPIAYKNHFENMFYSTYKTSELISLEENILPKDATYIHYKDNTAFAHRATFSKDGSYIDPFKDVLSVFNNVDKQSSLTIFFTLNYKAHKSFRRKTIDGVWKIFSRILFKRKKESSEEEQKKDKEKAEETDIYIKIGYNLSTADQALKTIIQSNIKNVMSIFFDKGWVDTRINSPKTHKLDRSQACNFFHMPTQANYVPQLDYAVFRKLPSPSNIGTLQNTPAAKLTSVWQTDYRGEKSLFGIKEEDKFRHMYIIWKTWAWKSNFLSNLIRDDIHSGKWVGLLDPHGELVDTILEHIPSHRINDVILFDVSDDEFPVWFNLLSHKSEDEKLRVVSGVVTTFKKLFWHSWWPRLEYILRNVLLSIVDYPNATLLHIMRMLTDKAFREEVLKFVKDNLLIKFWREEFGKWNDKQIQDAIGPITNKVGQFLSSSVVRNIFGQPRAKLNMREAMDSWKIVLINLSKGKIGADNAAMIWSLLVTKFQIDAMSRADIKADKRVPFYLYIDEFQNFATDSFAEILSEARKYKLSIIVANQYSSQLLPEIRDAIFGNIGTIISFTLGYDDAKIISNQFKEMVSVNDLISLPKYTTYSRMMIDWVTCDPFSMKTLKIPDVEWSDKIIQKITEQSRQRYSMERKELEALVSAWAKKNFSAQEKVAEKAKLEWLGLTNEEIENLDVHAVQTRMQLFLDYRIWGIEPDAMLFDIEQWDHKAIWYTKPEWFEKVAILDMKRIKGKHYYKDDKLIYEIKIGMFEHNSLNSEDQDKLDIWIGSFAEAREQLLHGFQKKSKRKFVRNIEKIRKSKPITVSVPWTREWTHKAEPNLQQTKWNAYEGSSFSIKDVVVGKEYEWYVKLIYNYGIFITVKWVEGLLHKNYIIEPGAGVSWKKFYNIWDKIKAYAAAFKDINGQQKIVRSQYTTEQTKLIDAKFDAQKKWAK